LKLRIKESRQPNQHVLRYETVNRLNRSTTSIGCPGLASEIRNTENYTSNALGYHQGTLVKSYSYDVFGQVTIVDASTGNSIPQSAHGVRHFYTGHDFQAELGLYLTHYRAYEPVLGRWLSRDPIGELGPDGPNLYGYVRNDPLNRFDPFGDTSKTHGTFNGVMVHSEVPTAGGGTGNVHLQSGNSKFFFNTQTGAFDGLPKDIAKQMENNKGLRNAIKNAVNRVNCEGAGFAPKYGGGLGKYVPAIAVALALLDGTAQAEELANLTRDYMAASASGDEGKKLMNAAAIANQLNGITPLAGDIALGELLK
jgi:RHS repeat-associated protein